ncbi:MAG: hypothetical protein AAGF23_26315, partial [Acidobacteriota bacterium]
MSVDAALAGSGDRPGPEDVVLPNVLTFVALLRRAGIRVTTGQTVDFSRALSYLDLGDREQVR